MTMTDRRERRRRLVEVAGAQSGYFSAAQALEVGYSYQAQKQNADRGSWRKVARGIFRLPEWPAGGREDLVRLALWSHDRAVVSHESALSLHDLGDVNPSGIHLTVPPGFRQRPPAGVALHRAELPPADVRRQEGFQVTTPLRSLLDVAGGDLDLDLRQAVRDGDEVRERVIEALAEDPEGDGFEFRIGPTRTIDVDEAGRPGWRFLVDPRLGR